MEMQYSVKSDLMSGVEPKKFTTDGQFHYYIRIFIEAAPAALDQIEFVKYTLHPTFRDRNRVSTNRATNFDIKIWTYGYFDVQALIVTKDGQSIPISGFVQWTIPKGIPFANK
jgi:hypothetical protein